MFIERLPFRHYDSALIPIDTPRTRPVIGSEISPTVAEASAASRIGGVDSAQNLAIFLSLAACGTGSFGHVEAEGLTAN